MIFLYPTPFAPPPLSSPQATRRFLRVYVEDEAKAGLLAKVKSKLKEVFNKKKTTANEASKDDDVKDEKLKEKDGGGGGGVDGEKDHATNGSCLSQSRTESDE